MPVQAADCKVIGTGSGETSSRAAHERTFLSGTIAEFIHMYSMYFRPGGEELDSRLRGNDGREGGK